MQAGQSGTVAQLIGEPKLLKEFMDHGIRIGLKIQVNSQNDNENPIHINFGFRKIVVNPEVAKYILVNIDPPSSEAEEDFSKWTIDPKDI